MIDKHENDNHPRGRCSGATSEVRRRKKPILKDTVNDVLRLGLRARRELASAPPFKVRARALGQKRGINYDDIGDLLE